MDFHGGPTPHLHRKYSDHWALQRSGAEVHDETSFIGLEDSGDRVVVTAKHGGEPRTYDVSHVIGADGPSSGVVRAVVPGYAKTIDWFIVGQKFHEIKSCPLDPDLFSFLVSPRSRTLHLEP